MSDSFPANHFVVSIHDVAPSNAEEIAHIVEALCPRVGTALSAAVIPAAFGQGSGARLAGFVRSHCREIALHGYSHLARRRFHPLALLTRNSSEFIGLSPLELRTRLRCGQDILQGVFGRAASVLVPPAWCHGRLTSAIADSCGLPVVVAMTHLATRGRRVPLAVYSWDLGRIGRLGWAGEIWGRVRHQWAAAMPCVVLHPRDVSRRLFGRGLAIIDALLRSGRSPVTFAEVPATPPAPCQPVPAEK